jgi:hypothetical protein
LICHLLFPLSSSIIISLWNLILKRCFAYPLCTQPLIITVSWTVS